MKKTNIITIILTILVIGLTGYIIYDKALSKEETPNNNENTNMNQNNNNNDDMQNEDEESNNTSATIKKYIGCTTDKNQREYFNNMGDYVVYVLELKENGMCALSSGSFSKTGNGGLDYQESECVVNDSYIKLKSSEIIPGIYFKINSNNQITYQNTNVIMKSVPIDENESLYCSKNY